jgi:hypothetical protein
VSTGLSLLPKPLSLSLLHESPLTSMYQFFWDDVDVYSTLWFGILS